jgi:DNA-binding XRE family transcriptional regulator
MAEPQMSAEQFRAIRRRAGLTQVEFAQQLGYNHFSISKIETGVRMIPAKLRRLVLALFRPDVPSKKPRSSRVVRSKR